ncbi:unnamed protein product [Closterium sp. NIES-53]
MLTRHWSGSRGVTATFCVWGSLTHVRTPGVDKLFACTIPCVFLSVSHITPYLSLPPLTSQRPVLVDSGGAGGATAEGAGPGGAGTSSGDSGGAGARGEALSVEDTHALRWRPCPTSPPSFPYLPQFPPCSPLQPSDAESGGVPAGGTGGTGGVFDGGTSTRGAESGGVGSGGIRYGAPAQPAIR